jgi:hypothetical protein
MDWSARSSRATPTSAEALCRDHEKKPPERSGGFFLRQWAPSDQRATAAICETQLFRATAAGEASDRDAAIRDADHFCTAEAFLSGGTLGFARAAATVAPVTPVKITVADDRTDAIRADPELDALGRGGGGKGGSERKAGKGERGDECGAQEFCGHDGSFFVVVPGKARPTIKVPSCQTDKTDFTATREVFR